MQFSFAVFQLNLLNKIFQRFYRIKNENRRNFQPKLLFFVFTVAFLNLHNFVFAIRVNSMFFDWPKNFSSSFFQAIAFFALERSHLELYRVSDEMFRHQTDGHINFLIFRRWINFMQFWCCKSNEAQDKNQNTFFHLERTLETEEKVRMNMFVKNRFNKCRSYRDSPKQFSLRLFTRFQVFNELLIFYDCI